MGRNFIVTRSRRTESGRKKKTISKSIVIGPGAIKFVTLTAIAVLAIVYLSQSTAGASRSIEVRDIQTTKNNLSLEQERLQAEQTRLKSLQQIDNGTQKTVMEPVTNVNYVNGTPVHN
ncbi:MAG: hypothetical protein Q7S80_01325 [bacterium]|nr:hypothetical protein [bacterium]